VIRTSINRDDLFICVRLIPRGKTNSFNILYFLLDAVTAGTGETSTLTPKRIPKIIVFINNIIKIQAAVECLRIIFYVKPVTSSASERYINTADDFYLVHDIISILTARVLKYDQEIRFNEFKSS